MLLAVTGHDEVVLTPPCTTTRGFWEVIINEGSVYM
jgi:hypothetical protein